MRIRFPKYKFILLSVVLVTGIHITGWVLAFYYDKTKRAEPQKKLENDTQAVNEAPLTLDPNKIMLVLVCVGLVGFFGIRRKSATAKKYFEMNQPECRIPPDFLNDEIPIKQKCYRGDTCCVPS